MSTLNDELEREIELTIQASLEQIGEDNFARQNREVDLQSTIAIQIAKEQAEKDLQRALEASKQQTTQTIHRNRQNSNLEVVDEEFMLALQMSALETSNNQQQDNNIEEDDEELRQALLLSTENIRTNHHQHGVVSSSTSTSNLSSSSTTNNNGNIQQLSAPLTFQYVAPAIPAQALVPASAPALVIKPLTVADKARMMHMNLRMNVGYKHQTTDSAIEYILEMLIKKVSGEVTSSALLQVLNSDQYKQTKANNKKLYDPLTAALGKLVEFDAAQEKKKQAAAVKS